MTARLVYVSEELQQALGPFPDNLHRLGVLAALATLEEGDLKAVCFFASWFSGRRSDVREAAQGLLWLRGHRYVQARTTPHRDFFWQRPDENDVYCLTAEGLALYQRLLPSTYKDHPPRISPFDKLLQQVGCSEYTFWSVTIITVGLALFALTLLFSGHR